MSLNGNFMNKQFFIILFILNLSLCLSLRAEYLVGDSITFKPKLPAICSVNIDRVIIGDCEYGSRTGNQSKVIVAVFLSWTMATPGDKIQVRLKGMTKIFDPFLKGCPPYVQFILDPDGANYTIDASFVSGACSSNPYNLLLPVPCDPPICLGTQSIGGKVFSDFNNNGIQESSENGILGIEVRLYNDAKQLQAVTTTKTKGLWSVDQLTAGQKMRVEYQIPSGLFDANPGLENKTRTQIAAVGNCAVDLGIFQLNDLIDPQPWMVTSVFVKGDALNPMSPAYNEPTLVVNHYSTTEGGPRLGPNGNYYAASAGETGSIWGLGFQKETRMLYSGSFLKRNASLGPGGLGAVYVTDLNNFLPNPQMAPNFRYYGRTKILLNLDSFGIQTGDESTLFRNLPFSPNDASHDSSTFDKIGKWGLGDIDLNDAGDTLFVVNLYNRSLVTIAIGNPLQLPITADRVKEIPIPDPGCSIYDDWRPWGLKYRDGKIFVGGVCSAESTNNSDDLRATVYTYANGVFKKEVEFDLNYFKGFLNDNYCGTFRPWNRDFYKFSIFNDVVCGPVPVLSDIEFDSEGNMIISLGDRYGHQTGGRDYGTNTKDNLRYITFAGGDNLKLFKLKGEYLLEQNGTSGFYTTQGKNNNQGVCGGEFYFQDGFYSHQESALGSLAAHPSYNTIIATLMDPANVWSNGWSQLDNSLGTKKVNYNIYTGEYGTFGKATGLGDIELLIAASSGKGIGVSIGNYIWNDKDLDGVQDPGEPSMANIPVLIYNQKDSLIKQTVSDTNGLYYFRNLDPYTYYTIQIGADSNYLNKQLILNNKSYTTTKFQSRVNFGNSENDSDASQTLPLSARYQEKIALNYLSGRDGENDFSLDFGLLSCDQIKPDTVTYVLCNYDSIKVGNSWFSISNPTGLISMPNTRGYGCDSLILVKTNFLSPTNANLDTTICKGEKLVIHNQTFDENNPTGTIKLFGGNHRGCDSTIQVQLNFYPIATSQLDTSVCTAGKIIIHNQTFDEMHTSGVILLAGANYTGCDSSIHVNLRILPYSQSNLDTSICTGSYIVIHNQRFDETKLNGQINLSGANQFGCDSILHVNVNLLPLTKATIDTSICPGDFVMLYNQRFDESKRNGQIIRYGANEFGCDSIIDIHLSVRPNSTGKLDTSICPGGNVTIHQQIFNEQNKSASILLNRANQFGCDSILNVNLRIRPEYHLLDTIESCVEYTWSVNGKNYRTSGSYRFDTVTHEGCDSNYLMQLIIHPEYHFSDTLCALGNFYWSADHRRYEESGVYEFNHRSSSGCDSIEYLVLMIAHEGEVYVPNVFSPNGDQVNDRLVVFSNEDVHTIDLFAIYDRWGELMFEQKNILPNDPLYGWDGMFRGVPVNPDVFVYIVEWRDKARGYHKVTGDATLLR